MLNEWNKLSNDCVNASTSVNMFKNKIDRYLADTKGWAIYTDKFDNFVGASRRCRWHCEWLPCSLAIWNLKFWMAIFENLV